MEINYSQVASQFDDYCITDLIFVLSSIAQRRQIYWISPNENKRLNNQLNKDKLNEFYANKMLVKHLDVLTETHFMYEKYYQEIDNLTNL